VIGGDGEGLECLQVDLAGPVGIEKFGRGVAEPKALLDQALGRAEPCRDGRHGDAGLGQLRECDHLVGRMHGDAYDVLGERQLGGCGVAVDNEAGHGMGDVERAFRGKGLQRRQAPAARDYGVVAVRAFASDDEILEKPVVCDGGLQFGLGGGVGRRPAHVLRRDGQPVERDRLDRRLVDGSGLVHTVLHVWGR